MSTFDFDFIFNEHNPSLEFQTYASSPESIPSAVSEESSFSPSPSSDGVQFANNPLGNIVKVEEDLEETQGSNSKRRLRTTFSNDQLLYLKQLFAESKYLCRPKRIMTATKLGLQERQIKVWFQNQRMKQKKLEKENEDTNNGKISSFSANNDVKKRSNQLIATEDAKFRRMNTSAGFRPTVHHHLPQNIDSNTKLYNSYFSNTVNYQTAYSGSQQTGNINYTESCSYGNYNTNVYNNDNNCCYSTKNVINSNQNTCSYFSQPVDKDMNCNDYEIYYENSKIGVSDLNLYSIGENQTSEQNLSFSTKSEPSFDFFDDINGSNFLSTVLDV
ncbi:homeobox protein Hox-A2-like [Microplitis demolitor]|uniref:homeobox protein Hox-A2-like n=1 Tax=Microplitis demolitor TaxID=69319 RepID=UPI00235B6856|nr:homeobox protein Hox-A2-like [Microplitis demolitor]XP_053595537.1 homeobox protein Hox-A2-like [Microplitis demolitor]